MRFIFVVFLFFLLILSHLSQAIESMAKSHQFFPENGRIINARNCDKLDEILNILKTREENPLSFQRKSPRLANPYKAIYPQDGVKRTLVISADIHGDLLALLGPLINEGVADIDFENPYVYLQLRKSNEEKYIKILNIKIKKNVDSTKIGFIFLGDYVDRGRFSLEVLFTLIYLFDQQNQMISAGDGNDEDQDEDKSLDNNPLIETPLLQMVLGNHEHLHMTYDFTVKRSISIGLQNGVYKGIDPLFIGTEQDQEDSKDCLKAMRERFFQSILNGSMTLAATEAGILFAHSGITSSFLKDIINFDHTFKDDWKKNRTNLEWVVRKLNDLLQQNIYDRHLNCLLSCSNSIIWARAKNHQKKFVNYFQMAVGHEHQSTDEIKEFYKISSENMNPILGFDVMQSLGNFNLDEVISNMKYFVLIPSDHGQFSTEEVLYFERKQDSHTSEVYYTRTNFSDPDGPDEDD